MTDYDAILGILQRREIPYAVKDGIISIERDGSTDKVMGYMGFAVDFSFNTDGALKAIGIWE